jgi:hypothetical protein
VGAVRKRVQAYVCGSARASGERVGRENKTKRGRECGSKRSREREFERESSRERVCRCVKSESLPEESGRYVGQKGKNIKRNP